MSMGKRVRERQHYTLGGINGRNQAIARFDRWSLSVIAMSRQRIGGDW
jgi:hypothetical protein